jgi:hypothetical protein
MGQDRQDWQDRRARLTEQAEQADQSAIRNATRYERALAAKAIIPLALVGLVIVVYRAVHG